MEKVLLVEDAPDFQLIVKRALMASQCELVIAGSADEARKLFAQAAFDLVLLDVNLPDSDGFTFCEELRQTAQTRDVPVIFLTGRCDLQDKVTAFNVGADDYLVKPFDLIEFKARVEAKLARIRRGKSSEGKLVRGSIVIDLASHRVMLDANPTSRNLHLTPIEFKLLHQLARAPERVYTRDQLLTLVWGQDVHVTDRTVDKHVSTLRQKLGAYSWQVDSVPGVGYRFLLTRFEKKAA